MKKISLILLMTFAVHFPTDAVSRSFQNGNDFLEKPDIQQANYVMGVFDGMSALNEALSKEMFICLPERATSGQVTAIVKKHMNEHPEQRHLSASSLVALSLVTAFPCK